MFLVPSPTPTFAEPLSQGPERADDDGDRILLARSRGDPLALRVHTTRCRQGHR